jgi:predicted pyridoxine 5'-phosphate oxidase superfamily flavin-nucleotide-binding protein
MFSPAVLTVQAAEGAPGFDGRGVAGSGDVLGEAEVAFLTARDSFYMATNGADGWPYLQHRGGPRGFLRVLDERTIAFAEFVGNRQYISQGNLTSDDRVSLFFMDFERRARLKVLGRVSRCLFADNPGLSEAVALTGYRARADRALVVRIEAYDWNCPSHIPELYSREALVPLVEEVERLRRIVAEAGLDG